MTDFDAVIKSTSANTAGSGLSTGGGDFGTSGGDVDAGGGSVHAGGGVNATGGTVDASALGGTIPYVTVQSGAPSTYQTPLVQDTTAVTGGVYAWDGAAYQKISSV